MLSEYQFDAAQDRAGRWAHSALENAHHLDRAPGQFGEALLREARVEPSLPEVTVHGTNGTQTLVPASNARCTAGQLADTARTDSLRTVTDADPYWKRIPALRHARGLSQAELFRRTKGVGFDTIRALEQDPSRDREDGKRSRARYPSASTIEALAGALEVDPSEFPEYRLARARALLDERVREDGLEGALATLTQITDALRTAALRSATEVERRAHTDLLNLTTPGAARTPPEAEQRGS